jgi:hypothetical protein
MWYRDASRSYEALSNRILRSSNNSRKLKDAENMDDRQGIREKALVRQTTEIK